MPIFLKDPTASDGALKKYDDPELAQQAIARLGYVEASEQEVEQRTIERQYGDRNVGSFMRAAGAGAFDAAVAPARLAGALGATLVGAENKDPLGHFASGREFMANLAAVTSELTGGDNAEKAYRDFTEEARNLARANPWASTTGYMAGSVVGGLGLSGASAKLGQAAASAAASGTLGRLAASRVGQAAAQGVVEGGVEGATLAIGEAGEQAWISNEKLTSEQVLGTVGLGALIGGGAGGALYGTGAIYQGAKAGARKAAGDATERASQLFGPRATASSEVVEEVGARALGAKTASGFGKAAKDAAEWLRNKVEQGQAVSTGADIEAIQKYGGTRWDGEAIRGRDLYINRDAIVESAKKDFNQSLTELSNAAEPVIEEYWRFGQKKAHVAANLSDNAAVQLAEARTQADALESMLVPLRKPGAKPKGKPAPIDRERFVSEHPDIDDAGRAALDDELDDEIRETLESIGKEKAKEGDRAWQRAEQDVLQERVHRTSADRAQASPDSPEGAMRAEVGSPGTLAEVDRYTSRLLGQIRKTQDPAEAYMLLDSAKRGLQRYADTTGKAATNMARRNPERSYGARKLSDYLERFQEPLRQSLENEAVWGKAGLNQRALNEAGKRYIDSGKLFNQRFMRTESVGYRGLGASRVPNENATSTFLERLGLAENAPVEQYLRAHLRSTDDFLGAIGESLDIGEKAALVGAAKQRSEALRTILDKLEGNVKVANQVKAVLDADSGAMGIGGAKTIVGSILGGGAGALAGFAADAVTSPGRMMRNAIGVQRLARRFNVDLEKGLDNAFARAERREAPKPPPGAPAAAKPKGQVEPDPVPGVDDEVFKDEVSGVRPRIDPATVAGGVALVGAGAAAGGAADDEGGAVAGAVAAPLMGRAALRKLARGGLGLAKAGAAHVTPAGVAVPLSLRAFMGDKTDKQDAFKARAAEVLGATDNMGEAIRNRVTEGMAELQEDFPGFANGLTNGATRAALFLESKLPRSYQAQVPGAKGRSTRPVADHDIAKFARYWGAVNDPVSVLHDLGQGTMTSEQVEAMKAVYPELWTEISGKLLDRAARADQAGRRLPAQLRSQIGRFVGFEPEPAFRSSVVSTLEQARGERDQKAAQGAPGGARQPIGNLGASASTLTQQVNARAAAG